MLIDITPLKVSRDYRLLFFGQMLSFLGTMITFVVVPAHMYAITGSSLYVGLLGVAEFIPMFGLAFLGGAMADAADRRKILRWTEFGQAFTTVLMLINALLPDPQVWLLFVAVGLHAGLAGLQRPAFESLMQKIVPLEHMTAVSALNSMRSEFGFIIGPILGGFVAMNYGFAAGYILDLISFAGTIAAVLMISAVPKPENADRVSLASIVKGFKYAVSRQELLGTYLIDINAMFFGMPKALFPAIAASMAAGASLGLFYSSIAVGALVATLTSGWTKWVYRHGLVITLAAAGWGVGIILFGFSESLYPALFFLGVAGFFDMISGIFRGAVWNQTIPEHYRGRLAGIEMISFLTGPMLGDAQSGVFAHFFGNKTAIISGGVLTIVGTIILAMLLPRFIKYDVRDGMKLKKAEEEAWAARTLI